MTWNALVAGLRSCMAPVLKSELDLQPNLALFYNINPLVDGVGSSKDPVARQNQTEAL